MRLKNTNASNVSIKSTMIEASQSTGRHDVLTDRLSADTHINIQDVNNASNRISEINDAPCINSSKFLSQPSENLSKDFEKGLKISDINTSSPDGDKFNESGSSSVENPR